MSEYAEGDPGSRLNAGLRAWQAWRRDVAETAEAENRQWQIDNAEQIAEFERLREQERREKEAAWKNICCAKRRAAKLQRQVSWADKAVIAAIYKEARRLTKETGLPHHVDHEIPLRGKLVSGLHVHNNLRIITAISNIEKGNRFEVES